MKRRDALKNIGLSTGFVLATPSIFSLLQSCKTDAATWTPIFLSEEHGVVLKGIVDVILPKTDIPSATEVNVPEFIDKYFDEVLTREDQSQIKNNFDELLSLLKSDYNSNVSKITEEDYKNLLDTHLMLNSEESSMENESSIAISQLLNRLRGMCIHAYRISETVGETILAYDPIPGAYYCGDLMELTGGKSWSL